mgnify:CR=1 FL=1
MPQFLVRDAAPADLDGLFAVAEHLDSVNLPHDRGVIDGQVQHSLRSFSGALDLFQREYLFVLVMVDDAHHERVIGTSMIHAQHGTRRAPHIFFDVATDERYSETLDRHFVHQVLRIGYNYNGPTEIGGLILDPAFRGGQGHGMALGKWLSYIRFLYMACHRQCFRDEVLSELLPPLEEDGTSLLWEHLGRHFTGLSYQEADRISKTNKEFIRSLFPSDPIYTSLLPHHVRSLIGQVGPETRGVEKMLRRIGFRYAQRIDPFDGGPHFIARTDDITLLREVKRARLMAIDSADEGRPFGLVSVLRDHAPHFRVTGSRYRIDGDRVALPESARRLLDAAPGDEVAILPM